jgi:single-stranded-DNA-specific exonuclease
MQETPTKWILPDPVSPEAVVDGDVGLPPILRQLLHQRGIRDPKDVEQFINPKLRDLSDPFDIPEMDRAVERIFEAVDRRESVCIFGDYDVDGVTSVALVQRVLRDYGIEARHFIPVRSSEGYGLGQLALERCMAEGPKPDLLVAVDCGTASVEEIAGLRREGIDVVVVDHHEPSQKGRPPCNAFVNPKSEAADGYLSNLCAAGVAFKLAHALLKTRTIEGIDREEYLRDLLELVALGTIADIVPMTGENRILVSHGLRRLPYTRRPGLRALQDICGLNGHATSMDIGFRLGPRINAAGRMDNPLDALEILLTECRRTAFDLADCLEQYNRARQACELQIRDEAKEQLSAQNFDPARDSVIVLGSRDWHPGVVGIVASRLMRQYYRPAFVVAFDDQGLGKGSGRSVEGVSLVAAIEHCRNLLDAGGGHEMAAGISVREDKFAEFRKCFGEFVKTTFAPELLRPTLRLDAELSLDQLSLDFLSSYERLQPFGNGNPQPSFFVRDVHLARPPAHLRNNHLRLFLRQGYCEHDAMFFSGGDRPLPDPPWDVAFTIDRNTFRGQTRLQMVIKDIRAAE